MSGVFVNYRSGPHFVAVAALADRLVQHFGGDQVFFDRRMTSGTRYPDELRAQVNARDVLIAVIHDGWDQEWREDKDWVRFEIATAFEQGKQVVPVLLENTAQLTADRLPENVAELTLRQSARLRAAHWSEDVENLLSHLDMLVGPTPAERQEPKPKRHRLTPRVLGWALVFFLLLFVNYHDTDPPWLIFLVMALASVIVLALAVLLASAIPLLLNRRFHPLEQRVGGMPFRRYAQRIWIVVALMLIVVGVTLIDFATAGGSWRIGVAAAALVVLVYRAHWLWINRTDEDSAWPPPVSTAPMLFRRAAVRLHERLTGWPEWKKPRPRTLQLQAALVYLALAETRLELRARTELGWRPWLAAGHYTFAAFYLGWAASVAVLDLIALVAAVWNHATATKFFVLSGAVLVLSVVCAVIAVWLELRADRAHTRRHVDELTEWQAKLGPLVFER